MMNNKKMIGIGILIGIICLVSFYFLYWIRTPIYSINIIKEAVQNMM